MISPKYIFISVAIISSLCAATAQARFLQTDPVGYSPDPNLYVYVGNDPSNRTDPHGLCDDVNACDPQSQTVLNSPAGQQGQAVAVGGGLIVASIFIPGPEELVLAGAAAKFFGNPATRIAVLGHAQRVLTRQGSGTGHAMRSLREAVHLSKSGKYESVHLNQRLSTITEGRIDSKLQPDVAAVRPDGKIDIREVASGRQTRQQLEEKYRAALGNRAGEIKVVTPRLECPTGTRICGGGW